MDKTTVGPNPQPEPRKPFLSVGFILLGVVVVVLAGSFLLDTHFQSHVGIEHVARTPIRSSSTPAGHKGGAAPATTQSTGTVPSTSVPTVQPTPTLSPRQQVVQAYHRYWQDYRQALYTLKVSPMNRVAAGNELRRVAAEVAGFRKRGYAVHVRVTHHALIVSIARDKATVYDEILNRSYAVDPVTKQPGQGSSQADRERNIYSVQKIHGVWKVIQVLRQGG